jgi:hypothetical protein
MKDNVTANFLKVEYQGLEMGQDLARNTQARVRK